MNNEQLGRMTSAIKRMREALEEVNYIREELREYYNGLSPLDYAKEGTYKVGTSLWEINALKDAYEEVELAIGGIEYILEVES